MEDSSEQISLDGLPEGPNAPSHAQIIKHKEGLEPGERLVFVDSGGPTMEALPYRLRQDFRVWCKNIKEPEDPSCDEEA